VPTTAIRDQHHANAAILIWQSRYRLLLLLAAGVGTLGLRWAGALTEDSVVARRLGEGTAVALCASLIGAYFAFVGLLTLRLLKRRRVGQWAVVVTLIADVITYHGVMVLVTPPEWYERALILATFTLQLAMLYFGWRVAAWNLLGIVAAYFAMIVLASAADPGFSVAESMWTLGLFTMAVTAFLSLQADLGHRLASIIQVFDRAHEGDFSLTFDEDPGTHADRITVIGGAYDKMRSQLTSVILTDPLTGCYNARGFDQLAAREVSRAARGHSTLAMIALDLDHFKEINDQYGHLAGDDVLRDVGGVLRATARLSDVVGRMGGEEFNILAPDTDKHGAMLFAARILEAVRNHAFTHVNGQRLTISIGVAVESARVDDVARLLRISADEALYVAKRAGRDRAEPWHEGQATRVSRGVAGVVLPSKNS
jgi:diguanylate cyclase (GGDEF)-like protein